jgi:hypothetical protein
MVLEICRKDVLDLCTNLLLRAPSKSSQGQKVERGGGGNRKQWHDIMKEGGQIT